MSLDTYGHVFDELEGTDRRSAENMIRKARATSVRPRRRRQVRKQKLRLSGAFLRADARTRTGDPFITSEVLYQLSYVGRRARV